jgi:hypothetical protein
MAAKRSLIVMAYLLGLHNFYAGYNGRGAAKLILSILGFAMDASTNFYSGFFYLTTGIAAVCTLIELFTTSTDRAGNVMAWPGETISVLPTGYLKHGNFPQ